MIEDENIRDILRRNGFRSTKQRYAILDILKTSDQPISAEQIFNELKDKNISANISTVYRVLDDFVSKNLVIKLSISGSNSALFEYNHMVHRHYLICLGCKKILPIDYCPLEEYEKTLSNNTGFIIAGHKLHIYGYCPTCKEKKL